MAARDLGLTSGSGEDVGERLEPWDLATFGGGGEADAERFARDLGLRTGEAEATCADVRLLGLKRQKSKSIYNGKPYGKTNGRPIQSVYVVPCPQVGGQMPSVTIV